jgi:SAM-dependent methyltransferase
MKAGWLHKRSPPRQQKARAFSAASDDCEGMESGRFYEQPIAGSRRSAPAALRNREPIAALLPGILPEAGNVLEIASGTGEHAAFFARQFPSLTWQPTDPDEGAIASIRAWRAESDLPNLCEPLMLDAESPDWPVDRADAILCINMVHISPWAATLGLLTGAGRLLPPGAPLILYGPYRRAGVPTAPSNEGFDRSLRSRDPRWGLRDVESVAAEAVARGLSFERLFEMPANNLTIIFRRV